MPQPTYMPQPYMQPYHMPPMHYMYPDHSYQPRFRTPYRPPPPHHMMDPNYYGPMPPRGMRTRPRFIRPRFPSASFSRRPLRPPPQNDRDESKKPLPRKPWLKQWIGDGYFFRPRYDSYFFLLIFFFDKSVHKKPLPFSINECVITNDIFKIKNN